MEEFLGLEQYSHPKFAELKTFNRHAVSTGMLMLGLVFLLHGAEGFLKKKPNLKATARRLKYFTGLSGGTITAIYACAIGGSYNRQEETISVKLGNDVEATKLHLAHENAHALFHEFIEEPEKVASWAHEGFAEGLAQHSLRYSGLAPRSRNFIHAESLYRLVTTYKLICDFEDISPELPERYDKFDLSALNIKSAGRHALGYTFFRIRDEQKGTSIYRQILTEGNLKAVEPFPSEDLRNVWL